MSILNRDQIRALLDLPIDDPKSLRITPLLEPEDQIKGESIDVRLGAYFLVPRTGKRSSFVPAVTPAEDVAQRVHLPPGRKLLLPGKGVVLASTFEFLKMPCHLTAQVLTRSSIGRIFITTATATLVHPLYRGCLTLEIVNLGSTCVELDILSRIAQLQFSEVARPADIRHDRVSGRYAASTEPEFPDYSHDQAEYRKIRSLMPRIE